jgi:hypothetical protein
VTPSLPIHRLKRDARLLSRSAGIPLHAALDRIAAREGFAAWSLLANRVAALTPAARLHARLEPGNLVLVGARPRQGKTLMGLELAREATRSGRRSIFFTLEYTEADIRDRLAAIGAPEMITDGLFGFDCSDAIDAGYILRQLATAPPRTLVVIDYLQLLDQRRDSPPLADQVRTLRAFARDRGAHHRLHRADRPEFRSGAEAPARPGRRPPAQSAGPVAVRQDLLPAGRRDPLPDDRLKQKSPAEAGLFIFDDGDGLRPDGPARRARAVPPASARDRARAGPGRRRA